VAAKHEVGGFGSGEKGRGRGGGRKMKKKRTVSSDSLLPRQKRREKTAVDRKKRKEREGCKEVKEADKFGRASWDPRSGVGG
jgi:hypothetical protein